MMDEVKGNFRFKRPWETPPHEEEEDSNKLPIILPIIKTDIKSEFPVIKSEPLDFQIQGPSSSSQLNTQNWSEDLEIFRFDKENLVLTSEKVTVKRESEEDNSNNSNKSSASGCNTSKRSSNQSNLSPRSKSSSSNSDSDSSSSSSSDSEDSTSRTCKVSQYEKKKSLPSDLKTNVKDKTEPHQEDGFEEDHDAGSYNNNYPLLDDSNSDVCDDDESDVDVDGDGDIEVDTNVRLEDFTEGRNRERKNSKWADYGVTRKSSRLISTKATFCNKSHKAQALKKLTSLIKKEPQELTEDDRMNLNAFPELAVEARKRLEKRQLASERMKEEEDPEDLLDKKCLRLASVIARAKYLVVYTGAGISTSASIPDYRGPNGIWTLLRKGQSLAEDLKQFPQSADPTITHMAIKELYERGVIKHIVSQNVDGLHLRSGIPKTALSEVHGNMYIEVCLECHREYVRLFDVTENTRRHQHKTGRFCYHCGSALKDSVVLFGEKGSLRWPINWAGAEYNVDKADVILCLGSSLKVLRRYPWLWCMSQPVKQRPKLYIVNLQWTPKDRFAALKINGRCDEVISKVMKNLGIPISGYKREEDAIFSLATPLHPSESSSNKDLSLPDGFPYPEKSTHLNNYFRFEPVFSKEVRALNQIKRKVVDGESEDEGFSNNSALNVKPKNICGIGWLGNALSKPKKKKIK